MSQYTIALNELLKIRYPETYADVSEKVKKGRELLFSYDYGVDDEEFKRRFESMFILEYLERDINNYDVDYWLAYLQLEIENKLPLFYKQWQAVNNIKSEMLLNSSITDYTDSSEHTNNSKTTNDSQGSSNSTATNSSKNKSSQFPQDILSSNFDDIKYMDAGTASENDSTADNVSKSTTNTENTANDTNSRVSRTSVTADVIPSLERIDRRLADIIETAVKSFNDMFMLIY